MHESARKARTAGALVGMSIIWTMVYRGARSWRGVVANAKALLVFVAFGLIVAGCLLRLHLSQLSVVDDGREA